VFKAKVELIPGQINDFLLINTFAILLVIAAERHGGNAHRRPSITNIFCPNIQKKSILMIDIFYLVKFTDDRRIGRILRRDFFAVEFCAADLCADFSSSFFKKYSTPVSAVIFHIFYLSSFRQEITFC
jgi:hypothetical protein